MNNLTLKRGINPQLRHIGRLLTIVLILALQSIPSLAMAQESAEPAIHMIIVADLNDTDIGVNIDVERWAKEITRIENNTQTTPLVHKITDRNPESILAACDNLNVAPNDTVIFIYGGHGFNKDEANNSDASAEPTANAGSKWPEMVVYENVNNRAKRRGLPLWRIFNKLESKKPRLLLVIGDCCNEYTPAFLAAETYTRGGEIEAYYKTLYLRCRGNYIVSAAKFGQYAFGSKTRGGFFTEKLFKVLGDATSYDRTRPSNYQPSWDQIFTEVSSGYIREDEIKGNQQAQWEKIAASSIDQ